VKKFVKDRIRSGVPQHTTDYLCSVSRLRELPEYVIWLSMRSRCKCKSHTSYKYYGGRGIAVCDKWRYDFVGFLSDVGKRPGPEYSIERIDNDGNYEPRNVRWATIAEQAKNKRPSSLSKCIVREDGRENTMSGWAAELGICPSALRKRFARLAMRSAILFAPNMRPRRG